MGVLLRGARNAFRNWLRTLSVILILAISIGLALVMLLSYKTVTNKIDSIKGSIGTEINVSPAGMRGFEGGGEPLTQTQVTAIKGLAHVSSVTATLSDRLTPSDTTSLASAIDPGTLGNRFRMREPGGNDSNAPSEPVGLGQQAPKSFSLPISVTGISDASILSTGGTSITSGSAFDAAKDEAKAVVGTELATKNSLSVGSTFTAYGATVTVSGIYDMGNKFGNANLYMPIRTVQRLSGQTDQLTSVTVKADTIANVDSVVAAIKDALGSDKVDVTSSKDTVSSTLTPLENIKSISLYSLVGALAAGAVITLLTMMMIVRERRREIGVLKAIGSSSVGVVMQFVSESMVLTLLGSIVGIIAGVLLSNPVLQALVNNNASSEAPGSGARAFSSGPGGMGAGRIVRFGGQIGGGVQNAVRDLHAAVGTDIILYGLAAALLIGIIGSAAPAWLIAKVKPAEVMRGE